MERLKVQLFHRSILSWIFFIIICILFLVAATSETLLIKFINVEYKVIWPCYTALLLSGGWMICVTPLFFRTRLAMANDAVSDDHMSEIHINFKELPSIIPPKLLLKQYILIGMTFFYLVYIRDFLTRSRNCEL